MKDLVQKIKSFQEVLNNLKKKDVLVAVFEDYKLDVSTTHPASNAGVKSCHGNQTKTSDYWILLQRNEISNGDHSSVNDNDSTLNETNNTQDTVGGPNMSDFDAEEEYQASNLKPISIDKARFLVSLFIQCLKSSVFDMPLCIVCDAEDAEAICLLEASPVIKQEKVSSLNITSYSSSGPVHTKSDLLTMDQLLSKTSMVNNQCSSVGFVQYDIMGKFYQDVSIASNLQQSHTSVKLDCVWDDVKNVLETPHGAKCTVHIKAVPGSLNSPAHLIYSELCTLKNFAAGLSSGEIQFATSETSVSKSSVETLLANLIETVKQGEQKKVLIKENDSSTDSPNVIKKFLVREDLDFTERLWILLKDHASSYNDILTSLRSVLGELHSGQLQPMVHRSNNSTLAKHIRASYQNKMTLNPKDVDGLEPLRILVEIGIDKLKRDYLSFFISEGLETLDRLQWYLSPPDKDNSDLEILTRRLEDLHRVSELYVVGSTSLRLPHDTLVTLVRWGLRHYENPEHSGDDHTFSIQVDRSVMFRFYSSFQPTVWQVEVQCSSSEMGVNRTVYQLSVNQPFDFISYNTANTTNVLDQTDAEGDQFTMYETMASTSPVAVLL